MSFEDSNIYLEEPESKVKIVYRFFDDSGVGYGCKIGMGFEAGCGLGNGYDFGDDESDGTLDGTGWGGGSGDGASCWNGY